MAKFYDNAISPSMIYNVAVTKPPKRQIKPVAPATNTPRFTQIELRNLARMVYLANLVVNSGREGSERVVKFDELEDKILRWIANSGLKELIEECEHGHAHPSFLLSEDVEVTAYLESYEDDIFWDELAHRLADRDFFRDHDDSDLAGLSAEQKIERKEPYLQKYRDLLQESGIDNFEF